mmetsp:Transcript_13023/g.12853  ORF Transcript_13023/g.12853 Transcript_13023/m.12853 type:complete len:121 (+) Transcript_13023:69-431(+)
MHSLVSEGVIVPMRAWLLFSLSRCYEKNEGEVAFFLVNPVWRPVDGLTQVHMVPMWVTEQFLLIPILVYSMVVVEQQSSTDQAQYSNPVVQPAAVSIYYLFSLPFSSLVLYYSIIVCVCE